MSKVFLFDFLHRLLLHNPWQLSEKQLDFGTVLKAANRDEIISGVIRKHRTDARKVPRAHLAEFVPLAGWPEVRHEVVAVGEQRGQAARVQEHHGVATAQPALPGVVDQVPKCWSAEAMSRRPQYWARIAANSAKSSG
jgi:hypothetical protein